MSEWKMVKIGEICEQINGVSYKPADVYDSLTENATVLLRANNIFEDKLNYDELVFVDKKRVSKNQYMKKGDILICASSGSKHLVGKAACLTEDKELTFGAFCKVLRPKTINPEYIKHYFFSPFYRTEISRLSEGANINNIKAADLENLTIPLPTESEQNRIAKQLDKCITIINKQKRALEKYDLLIKSRFIEMFGDSVTNSKNWNLKKLGDLLESIRYGTSTPPVYSETGYAFIRATNIKKGKIVNDDMKYISEEEAKKISKCKLNGNEILIVRSGVNSGDTCVVTKEYINQYAGYDMILVLGNQINPIYLNELLNTNYMEKMIKPLTRRAAQPHLNSEQTQSLPIILPPLSLQNDFAAFVHQIDKSKFEIWLYLNLCYIIEKRVFTYD